MQIVQGNQAPCRRCGRPRATPHRGDHRNTTHRLRIASEILHKQPRMAFPCVKSYKRTVAAAEPSHWQPEPGDLPLPVSSHLPSFLFLGSKPSQQPSSQMRRPRPRQVEVSPPTSTEGSKRGSWGDAWRWLYPESHSPDSPPPQWPLAVFLPSPSLQETKLFSRTQDTKRFQTALWLALCSFY